MQIDASLLVPNCTIKILVHLNKIFILSLNKFNFIHSVNQNGQNRVTLFCVLRNIEIISLFQVTLVVTNKNKRYSTKN